MARLRMKRCEKPGDITGKLTELVDQLASFGEPILRTGLKAQQAIIRHGDWVHVKRNSPARRAFSYGMPVIWGEIFVRDDEFYAIALKERGNIEDTDLLLYSVTKDVRTSELDAFASIASDVLKVGFNPHQYISASFERVRTELVEAFRAPTEAEIGLSRVLVDHQLRSLAIAMKQAGGLLLSDIPKQIKGTSTPDVQSMHGTLTKFGLVTNEIVVLCKNVSRQVLRVPTVEALADITNAGGRCACGRRIDEERQEQAIGLTDAGAALLDKSRWLSVLVYDALVKAGVAPERIVVEGTLGGDEVDCVAEISGELCLFELKDKEFNLGEAYSFGAKIGILSPEHAVVVTTAKVGGDAKQHLQRALKTTSDSATRYLMYEPDTRGVSRVSYIEGVEKLSEEITRFVSDIETKDAQTALQEILDSVSLGADRLIAALSSNTAQVPTARKPTKPTGRPGVSLGG